MTTQFPDIPGRIEPNFSLLRLLDILPLLCLLPFSVPSFPPPSQLFLGTHLHESLSRGWLLEDPTYDRHLTQSRKSGKTLER